MARILMLLTMLITGTATSQLPEFSQQYRQRLGGAIDALEKVLSDFQRDATSNGLTFNEAIALQKASDEEFIQARGHSMEAADRRLHNLKEQKVQLQDAGSLRSIMVIAQSLDGELARATMDDYELGVPVTSEGLVSAVLGGVGGLFGIRILMFLFGIRRRFRKAPPAAAET